MAYRKASPLIDFEGEPPAAGRTASAGFRLRDVAGVLRRSSTRRAAETRPPTKLAARAREWSSAIAPPSGDGWAASCRESTARFGAAVGRLRTDKAVYETGYETRHRAGLASIPPRLRIARLTAKDTGWCPVYWRACVLGLEACRVQREIYDGEARLSWVLAALAGILGQLRSPTPRDTSLLHDRQSAARGAGIVWDDAGCLSPRRC